MNRLFALCTLLITLPSMSALPAVAAPAASSVETASTLKATFYNAVARKAHDAALEAGKKYLVLQPADDVFALDYAYELLAAGHNAQADALLGRLSSSKNPDVAAAAAKQLAADKPSPAAETPSPDSLQQAYDLSAKGDHAGAAAALQAYLSLHPGDDRARLQFGYELAALGRTSEARGQFGQASRSSDPEVAAKAKAALGSASPSGTDRGSAYGYIIHDNRFADTFYGADVRYDLADGKTVPYVVAHLSNDSRSGAPGASDVFNDNTLVLAAGVRRALNRHLSAFAEAGQSIGLRGKQSFPEVRYGLTFYVESGLAPGPHTTLDASAVQYSRFTNFISYVGLTHDFPVAGPLRGVVGLNAAVDAHRLYYNNYAEVFGGVQFAIAKPVTLRVISAYGTYFDRGIGAPYSAYQSTRTELLFGFSFR
ncbi:MAG: hypothetical protein NVS9B12_04230 [Vulcanimicrobiaceae bacterium]